jgi:hypothetical protein
MRKLAEKIKFDKLVHYKLPEEETGEHE